MKKLEFQIGIATLSAIVLCTIRSKLHFSIDYSAFTSMMIFILLPNITQKDSIISKMLPFLHSGIRKMCNIGYLKQTLLDDYIVHYFIPLLVLCLYFVTNQYVLLCGAIACFIHIIFDLFQLKDFEYKIISWWVWILNFGTIVFVISQIIIGGKLI